MAAEINDELTALSIADASALIRQHQISPVELTYAYLGRIDRVDPALNSYITVCADAAIEQATELTHELNAGKWRGPLHGIPIALKDNIDTAGIPTTAANRMLADRVPDQNAPVYAKLKAAGAILLGKVNMHEFAYGGTSSVSDAGPVRNPWDRARIPGGSSGGSAAAVAARLCAAALGTDTLASIRLPAAYCGVTGIKPTHGLCSIRGIIPVAPSLDHVGPITRNAADNALMLREMTGFDSLDPVSVEAPYSAYADALQCSVTELRIGIPSQPYYAELDEDIAEAINEALRVLGTLTSGMREINLPRLPDFVALLAESYLWHAPFLNDEANHRFYHPSTLSRLLAVGEISSEHYLLAEREMRIARHRIDDVFNEVDVLVTPTTSDMPEPIEAAILAAADGAEPSVRNTVPFNLYGIPTISIPCGFSRDGLPIGMQLSAAHFNEATLFALAHAYQQETGWHLRGPNLSL
ncbi:MAG: amidase [Gammaproteobacteria bacterium]|nr:amidase [Gammaproteobacteria bacterium]